MLSQDKLIKNGIRYTDSLFLEIENRLKQGVMSSDTLESFIAATKEYTISNPLVVSGYSDKMISLILQETNNHKFSRPAQKKLARITIEQRVGEKITDVGDDIKDSVRDIVKEGYNQGLSQDEIADNISHRIGVIKNKRARAIARTEIARTATISDYIISKERGATHFYVECRNTACEKCKNAWHKNWTPETDETFEPSDKSAGGKGWIGDKEYSMSQTDKLPPIHPNCRCVAYFFKKEGAIKEANLNNGLYGNKLNHNKSGFFDRYKAPKGAKPIVILDEILEKELVGIVDSIEIPIILSLFGLFNKTVDNCDYEWIIGRTNKGYVPEKARTDKNKTEVILHDSLQNLEAPEKLLVVLHNHIWGMTPLYSDKDLRLYLSNNVKYGVTTNEMGVFVVRNNNKNKLSREDINTIILGMEKIDNSLIKKFEKDKKIKYDRNDDKHKYLLNEYLKDNFDEWEDKYSSVLSEYNMDTTFINAKKYNI